LDKNIRHAYARCLYQDVCRLGKNSGNLDSFNLWTCLKTKFLRLSNDPSELKTITNILRQNNLLASEGFQSGAIDRTLTYLHKTYAILSERSFLECIEEMRYDLEKMASLEKIGGMSLLVENPIFLLCQKILTTKTSQSQCNLTESSQTIPNFLP